MQKNIIGALALGLLSSSALAQSSVTVYGVADAGLLVERGAAAGNTTKVGSGIGSGSRLGIKGKEDLGGGMSLAFGLENGNNLDTGIPAQGGLLFGRQAYLCLTTPVGAFSIGRQYSPFYKTLNNIADPFQTGFAGNSQNIFANNSRVDNSVEYITPKVAGFSADVLYGYGEVAGDTSKNRSISASGTYENGPLTLVLAHQQRDNALATARSRNTMLTARYQFSMVTVHAAHARNKDLLENESKDTLLGFTVRLPVGTLLMSYIDHHDDSALRQDAKQGAVGYLYPLSRRTDLYTAYGHINNRNGAGFKVGTATDTGTGTTGFNLGVRHVF
nr:porin [uncultured Duganella sp.]